MERLRYKQSGKGIGHIIDVITSARPWSLRLRRVPADHLANGEDIRKDHYGTTYDVISSDSTTPLFK